MSNSLESIKAGDRVRVVNWDSRFLCVETVNRVTRTQIILGSTGRDRYSREHGRKLGGGSFVHKIDRKATSAECLFWNEKQEQYRIQREASAARETALLNKIYELQGLFSGGSVSSPAHTNRFSVEFENLTEKQVRELATKLSHVGQGER